MKTLHRDTQHGYIALVSAIIISMVLGLLAFTVSTREYFARNNALMSEYHAESSALADSCVHVALLHIAQDDTYSPIAGGEVVPVGADECKILSVSYSAEDVSGRKDATITTQGSYQHSWSTVRVRVSVRNRSRSTITEAVLHVTVRVLNNDGGVASPSDFTVHVGPAMLSPSPDTFSGSLLGATVSLHAGGPLTITVTGPSGYVEHQEGCGGVLPHGREAQCTMTEDDAPNIDMLTSVASAPPLTPHMMHDIEIISREEL